MRVFTVGIAVLGTFIAGQAAIAEVADKDLAAAKKERVVCRTTMVTGSRFEKRVCKTADEWEKQSEAHKDRWREELSKPVVPPDLRG